MLNLNSIVKTLIQESIAQEQDFSSVNIHFIFTKPNQKLSISQFREFSSNFSPKEADDSKQETICWHQSLQKLSPWHMDAMAKIRHCRLIDNNKCMMLKRQILFQGLYLVAIITKSLTWVSWFPAMSFSRSARRQAPIFLAFPALSRHPCLRWFMLLKRWKEQASTFLC